jgi:hypothetical protein
MPHAYSRPHFAISSLSSPLFDFDDLRAVASDWRFDGVDLDLTHWWSRRRLARIELPPQARRQSLHSLWIPASGIAVHDGDVTLSPWLQAIVQSTEEITIIVADSGDALGDHLRGRRFEQASRLREVVGDRHRVAIGVRAATRTAGRAHLMRLRALRSLTEEWDLGLALDLSNADDWQWEAEAAVFHAIPNLDLIRVALPGAAFDAHVRSRLTTRTIVAAIDAGFCGIFALAPHLAFWQWRNRDLMEALCGEGRERIVNTMRGERDALIRNDAPTWTRQ